MRYTQMAAAKKHIKIVKKRAFRPLFHNLAGRPALPTKYPSSMADLLRIQLPIQYADCKLHRHEALQPAPERYLQMCGRKLAQAQGYRQPSPETVQGTSSHAFGMSYLYCSRISRPEYGSGRSELRSKRSMGMSWRLSRKSMEVHMARFRS